MRLQHLQTMQKTENTAKKPSGGVKKKKEIHKEIKAPKKEKQFPPFMASKNQCRRQRKQHLLQPTD